MASANPSQMKSAEDRRRARELEEARKAGLAPAAVDDEGNEINPHIPQYMSSAVGAGGGRGGAGARGGAREKEGGRTRPTPNPSPLLSHGTSTRRVNR